MKKMFRIAFIIMVISVLASSCGVSENTKQRMREKSTKRSERNIGVLIDQVKKDISEAVTGTAETLKENYDQYVPKAKEKGNEIIEKAPDIIQSYVEHQTEFYDETISRFQEEKQEEIPVFPEGREIFGPYTVAWVSDGDTFAIYYPKEGTSVLNNDQTSVRYVRLIGVDTPESVAPDEYLEKSGKQNTSEGKTASNLTASLLPKGSHVWLESDVSDTDPYDRLLRYVYFIKDGETIMLNEYLLEQGAAKMVTIQPNSKYADSIFLKAQQKAIEENRGFWGEGYFQEDQ